MERYNPYAKLDDMIRDGKYPGFNLAEYRKSMHISIAIFVWSFIELAGCNAWVVGYGLISVALFPLCGMIASPVCTAAYAAVVMVVAFINFCRGVGYCAVAAIILNGVSFVLNALLLRSCKETDSAIVLWTCPPSYDAARRGGADGAAAQQNAAAQAPGQSNIPVAEVVDEGAVSVNVPVAAKAKAEPNPFE
jgi:uncharacterized membrane protein